MVPRIYDGERVVFFSIYNVGKTGQPHAKEWNWVPVLDHIHKNQVKWIKGLNIRPESIKFLVENISGKLLTLVLPVIFWIGHQKQKQQKQK